MTELEAALRIIAAELDRLRVPWALVGGLAVGTRAEPRTTRDVDVAVAVDDRGAERAVADLRAAGFTLRTVLEHEDLGRLATARLVAPGRGAPVIVDLLFASSGIEDGIVARAETLELVDGLHAPVATTGDLIALKLLARDDRRRPQDHDDLRALLRFATDADVHAARDAVRAIGAGGGSRGRDLEAALDELLRHR